MTGMLVTGHHVWGRAYEHDTHQEKLKYFDVIVKHAETICHYIEPRSKTITLTVNNSIVDVVIGDMLWHPTDMEGQTRENALSLFKRKEDGSYLVEITKSKQFLLATHYVRRGMSFAMAADAIHDAKEVCDIPKLGTYSDYLVASYARVACALLNKHISQVLCSKWAFLVAFDASIYRPSANLLGWCLHSVLLELCFGKPSYDYFPICWSAHWLGHVRDV